MFSIQTRFLVSAGRHMTHISTVTDKNGRYRLTGLAKSDDSRLIVVPPRGSRYLPIGVSPKTKDARDSVKLDMKLKSVALLRGQVKDSATGKPISGSIQYNSMAKNPNLADYPGFSSFDVHQCTTDKDGRYEIAVLPGEGVVTFRADESLSYRRVAKSKSKIGDRFTTLEEMGIYETAPNHIYPKDFQFLKQLQIEKNETDLELSIELSSGMSLNVRVVKSNGEPVPNAILNGTAEFSGWDSIRDGSLKIEGYYADQGRELFAYDPDSRQAAHVQLTGSQSGEVLVTLKPSGTLRGRLVDKHGVAISAARLLCESIPQDTGSVNLRYTTDNEGQFELHGVVPGYKHTVWALIEGVGMMAIAKDIDMEPSKGLDLGDVVVDAKK